jgi:hypothetical protein
MPDWRDDIRAHLDRVRIAPADAAEISEELRQHLDDTYEEARRRGADAAAARARAAAAPATPPPARPRSRSWATTSSSRTDSAPPSRGARSRSR